MVLPSFTYRSLPSKVDAEQKSWRWLGGHNQLPKSVLEPGCRVTVWDGSAWDAIRRRSMTVGIGLSRRRPCAP